MTFIQLGKADFIFVDEPPLLQTLVAEMTALRQEAGITIEELLADLQAQRQRRFAEQTQSNEQPDYDHL